MSNQEKYVEIDLMKYMPLNSYVALSPIFKRRLFATALSKVGTRKKLANILNINRNTLDNWLYNKKNRMPLSYAIKLLELGNFSIKDLKKNIKTVTAQRNAGAISIKNCKLCLDEEFAEWLGLLRGDGSISRTTTSCSNSLIDVCLFFSKFMEKKFGLNKNQIFVQICVPRGRHLAVANPIEEKFKKVGYLNVKSYKADKRKKAKEVNIRLSFHGKILAEILQKIRNELHNLLKSSSNEVKAAYLRGFCSAEGCASENKAGVRIITITQKNIPELIFVKSLLEDVGIGNIDGPRPTGTAFRLGITTQPELEKFQRLIGFGSHKIKNEKLKEMITHFKFSTYRLPAERRYNSIIEIIRRQQEVTVKFLSQSLSLRNERIRYLLSGMLKKGSIKVNKSRYPYTYSLGDDVG